MMIYTQLSDSVLNPDLHHLRVWPFATGFKGEL